MNSRLNRTICYLSVLKITVINSYSNGKLIGEKAVVDEEISAYGSCSTVFNGEAVIFGGWTSIDRFNRQVR